MTPTRTYDVFGAVRARTGTNISPRKFTGEQEDGLAGDTAYYFLRARYYDAGVGRFASKDPVEFDQRYAYAGGNPVRYVDPSGLCRNPFGGGVSRSIWRRIADAGDCAGDGVVWSLTGGTSELRERAADQSEDMRAGNAELAGGVTRALSGGFNTAAAAQAAEDQRTIQVANTPECAAATLSWYGTAASLVPGPGGVAAAAAFGGATGLVDVYAVGSGGAALVDAGGVFVSGSASAVGVPVVGTGVAVILSANATRGCVRALER